MDTATAFLHITLANLQDAQNSLSEAKQYTGIDLSHADKKIFSAICAVHLAITEHGDEIKQSKERSSQS